MDQLVGRLDRQLKKRTYLLKAAFSFEKKLKKIVGKVRDSLDENQILKTAVDELAIGLGIKCCNASLFDFEKRTSTIFYEYSTLEMATRRIAWMEDFPELYQHLIRGQHFQFCSLLPHPIRGRVAMLACPIIDEQGVLGDLWLVNHPNYTFTDRDISLVRQVAYQCATAVRQARLFREVQTKLEQLEELNRLKDDFLSTVSHELRSPITNLRMALTMLATSLDLEEVVSKSYDPQSVSENSTARYLRISYEECQRERKLIEDLLELQQFEFSARPLQTELISLQDWLPRLTVPFQMRARKRQQNFHLDIASNLPAIASEASSLERILTELLNNACKYTPPHGDITLAASSTLGDEILLSAINSGAEIPAEAIPKLFDKFYRVPDTDRWKQGGTGLGLALVKRLAEHLGGTIQVMSLDGETRFTLRLPSRLRKNMLTQPQTNDLLTQELRVI
ncbi:ATP-binding protein [Synechococcus sp. PCC 7336]|uniref:GAF domain-containing sensor histidine kinase n=1 Tax=Synechococcus sp. PCC 7336 TaxID=195250 RepID=UPI001D0D0C66|nr:ATP-binding protein [Synechococcus sp. PCC 7336]